MYYTNVLTLIYFTKLIYINHTWFTVSYMHYNYYKY